MTPTQTGDKPMVTRELLTCPFCDGEADFGTRPYKNSLWSIHCSGCTAYRVGQTRAEAIAAWNTRAQETLSPEQPLDTIQRLGQEFDAPEASPSLGMGEALDRIEATIDAAERCMNASPFWDENSRYAGKALLDYPRSQIAAERAALSPSPDLAEENERLREALEEELRDAADTFEKLAASMREEDADLMAPEIAVCEMQRSRIRATLQSISTGNP